MMLYHKWKVYRALRKKKRMLVFSKYPVPGKTKTRLISTLGSSGAATLQLLMVGARRVFVAYFRFSACAVARSRFFFADGAYP